MRRLALLLLVLMTMLARPLGAQDAGDDQTFLENWLQENLSAAGREVRISGFAGALSSKATIDEITIADDDGVWFTLRGAELDWTRSALLTGRLEVNSLSAKEIVVSRRPVSISDGPKAEASDFALPELPVSISIGRIHADRLVLGAPVLGVAAEMRLDGSGRLEGGAGEARLDLARIDGAEGALRLEGAYANETRFLSLDLRLNEGPGGIVAALTGLPGGGAVDLEITGEGPIDGFAANIALATEGTPRIAGQVALQSEETADGAAALGFRAELAGDPTALFAPDYRGFFGSDVRLSLDGQRHGDGRLDIASFDMMTDAMTLGGSVTLNPLGWPERAQLSGLVAAASGAPVLLPIGGERTRVGRMEIRLDYDSEQGEAWTGALSFERLARADLEIGSGTITGSGTLAPGAETPRVTGHLEIAAAGIAPRDPDLARAVGSTLTGGIDFEKQGGAPLRLSGIAIRAEDYGVTGAVTLASDWTRLDLIASGEVGIDAHDLGRFGGLAGRPLAGAARLRVAGELALPGGPFDIQISGTGQDLGIGEPRFDRIFAGQSTLSVVAARNVAGTRIERFEIAAAGATARASAQLRSTATEVEAQLDIPDGRVLAEGLAGPLSLRGTARRTGDEWQLDLDAAAPGDLSARLEGRFTQRGGAIEPVAGVLQATIGNLAPYSGLAGRRLSGGVALRAEGALDPADAAFALTGSAQGTDLGFALGDFDRLVAGESRADASLRRTAAGAWVIDRLDLTTPELTATVTGAGGVGQPTLDIQARLRDLGVVVPGLAGAFSAQGQATLSDQGWQLSVSGDGPGGTQVLVAGRVASDGGGADLTLGGRAPLALANAFIAPQQASGMAGFDLTLSGPFALSSLSGTVGSSDARLAVPALQMALDPVVATLRIAGGQASVEASAAASTGGRLGVSGGVALAAPFAADLAIRLDGLGLTDSRLYDTDIDGSLSVTGPLAGGAAISGSIGFGPVNLRVPETGFGIDGGIEGLVHIAEPADVRATRARAGLVGAGSARGGGRPYRLDIVLNAPNQVFLRGRGLDAELGGSLRLGGTTADIVPQGGFQLIRGRLDILGRRLDLTEGIVTLQGSLDPYLRLVAETRAEDVAVRIILEGLASDPSVAFASSPSLPEDEILARLVFGRGLDQISPMQALKLASAVATLSGRGGAGLIGGLREGFGLDDLELTTDAGGGIAVRAGAYITENIYTDVTVGADGRSEVNLNLSITPNLTARGSLSGDGETGIGIFFEKDY